MPTPNYKHEKRQRELAKQKKKEEKSRRKLDKTQPGPEGAPAAEGTDE